MEPPGSFGIDRRTINHWQIELSNQSASFFWFINLSATVTTTTTTAPAASPPSASVNTDASIYPPSQTAGAPMAGPINDQHPPPKLPLDLLGHQPIPQVSISEQHRPTTILDFTYPLLPIPTRLPLRGLNHNHNRSPNDQQSPQRRNPSYRRHSTLPV